jgi:hypothetical protein
MRTHRPRPEESLAAERRALAAIVSGEWTSVPTCTAIGAEAVAALDALAAELRD